MLTRGFWDPHNCERILLLKGQSNTGVMAVKEFLWVSSRFDWQY